MNARKRSWEVFKKPNMGRAPRGSPAVSITPNDRFSLNAPAIDILGRPEFVTLHYERSLKIVGFVASSLEDPTAYKTTYAKKGAGGAIVSGKAFLNYYSLSVRSRHYPAYPYQGMLCIDLGEETLRNEGREANVVIRRVG